MPCHKGSSGQSWCSHLQMLQQLVGAARLKHSCKHPSFGSLCQSMGVHLDIQAQCTSNVRCRSLRSGMAHYALVGLAGCSCPLSCCCCSTTAQLHDWQGALPICPDVPPCLDSQAQISGYAAGSLPCCPQKPTGKCRALRASEDHYFTVCLRVPMMPHKI